MTPSNDTKVNAPAVTLDHIRFTYRAGGFHLHIPALTFEASSATAVIGPSGSGKTTLLHMIAGILVPTQGTVRVGATVVSKLSDAARRRFRIARVGLVFQDFGLVDYLNVRENILLPYFLHPALNLNAAVRARVDRLAESLEVYSLLARRVTRLSQGERQRVALCRALVPGPEIVLADEPTGNLEPAMKTRLVDLLIEQAKRHETTLIMVTHDHSLLDRFHRTVDLESYKEGR